MNDILDSLRASKSYSMICDETLIRVCKTIAPRYAKQKEAEKAVRAHLHAICGAFLKGHDIEAACGLMASLNGDKEREIMALIMKKHVSAAERLPLLPGFYSELFEYIGTPRSIADIGCGINPLSIPFMDLESGFRYRAADINLQSLGIVSDYFSLLREFGRADARCEPCDVLSRLPDWPYSDMAFIFKLLPLVEQQNKGGGRLLLDGIRAKIIVVTFPTISIGGKRKGMSAHYSNYFLNLTAGSYEILYKKEYSNELVYAIKRIPEAI